MPKKKHVYKYRAKKTSASNRELFRTVLGILGVSAFVLSGLVGAVWAPPSHALEGFPIIDSGEGPAGQQDTNWNVMSSLGKSGAAYTTDNWIRLVDNGPNEITNMLNKTSFSSSDGFIADFDYRMTGGSSSYGIGDGFSFYLTNGNALVSNGGAGAGLAYATSNTAGLSDGVTDGMFGVGFDAYGSYGSSLNVGGSANCKRDGLGNNTSPNTIGIRGSGGKPGSSQCGEYPILGSKVWNVAGGIPTMSSPVDPSQDANSTYRHVRITVLPSGTSATVDVAMSDPVAKDQPYGAMSSILGGPVALTGVTLASSLKLGFGASTGGATQFLDLRRIVISAVADLGLSDIEWNSTPPTNPVNPGYLPGSPFSFSLGVWNGGPTSIPNGTADELPHLVADLTGLPVALSGASALAGNGAANLSNGIVDPSIDGNAAQAAWWAGVTNNSPANFAKLKVDGSIDSNAPAGEYSFDYYIPTVFPTEGVPTYNPDVMNVTPSAGISDPMTANNKKTATFMVAEVPNMEWGTPTASLTSAGEAAVDSEVTFTFPFTNTGNAPIQSIPSIVNFSGSGAQPTVTCTDSAGGPSVAIGGAGTCTATYALTQTDLNSGAVKLEISGVARADKVNSAAVRTAATYNVPASESSIEMSKSVSPETVSKEGDTVTYTFKVTNTGAISINDLSIEETSFNGTGNVENLTCPSGQIDPGEDVECTANYSFTLDDINSLAEGNTVQNTAVTKGSIFGGTQIISSEGATASVKGNPESSISLVKTVQAQDPAAGPHFSAGEVVDYKFSVTNNGATNLSIDPNTLIEDPTLDLSSLTCDPQLNAGWNTVSPNETVTCVVSYTLTQDDINQESVTNTATAKATFEPSGVNHEVFDSANTTLSENPIKALAVVGATGTVNATSWAAGEKVEIKVILVNSGQVTLKSPAATVGGFTGIVPSLTCDPSENINPGDSVTCTGEYSLTLADVNTGKVTFSANATAEAISGSEKVVADELTDSSFTGVGISKLALSKTAKDPDPFAVESKVTYTFNVANEGSTTVNNIEIAEEGPTAQGQPGDGSMSEIDCDEQSLEPQQSTTCTASYTLGQNDVNWGELVNVAVAKGTTLMGSAVTSAPATVTSGPYYTNPEQSRAQLSLTLAAPTIDPSDDINLGSPLIYTATVTNTGPVMVDGIAISSPTLSSGIDPGNYRVNCPREALDPGQSMECQYEYFVADWNLPVGMASIDAQVSGLNVHGDTTAAFTSNTATAHFTIPGGMEVTGTAELSSAGYAVGSTVTYTVHIENTGDSALNSLGVSVDSFSGSGSEPVFTCSPDPLDKGMTAECGASYTLTHEDVDNYYKSGGPALLVTALAKTGSDPANQWDKQLNFGPFEETFSGRPTVGIEVTGTDPTMSPQDFKAGASVEYTYMVTNTGVANFEGVTLEAVSGGKDFSCVPAIASLTPGGSASCTVVYTLTQDDIDAGNVSVGLNAIGLYGSNFGTAAGHLETLTVIPIGTISLTKTIGTVHAAAARGTVLPYSFEITNTGNATLTDIDLREISFSGTGDAPAISCPDGSLSSLAPGKMIVCTADYAVTQDDVNAQKIENTAGVSAKYYQGNETAKAESSYTYPIFSTAGISIMQTVSNLPENPRPGEELTFSFTVTNTGGYSLYNWKISSTDFTGDPALSISCPPDAPTILQPGVSVECSATYALNDNDLNAGKIVSKAEVTADPPSPLAPVTNSSTITSTIQASGGISIVKTASLAQNQKFEAGTTVDFNFVVTNTGVLPILGGIITDTLIVFESDGTQTQDTDVIDLSACQLPAQFEGGATYDCDATYTLTQNDIDWGGLNNTATVTGTFVHEGKPIDVEDTSMIVLSGIGASSIQLAKSISDPGVGKFLPETDVTYEFDIENTGTTTLQNVTLKDTHFSGSAPLGDITCDHQTNLAPGNARHCTATYTLNQTDVNAGILTNTATVDGQTLNNSLSVSHSASATLRGQGIKSAISITNQTMTKNGQNLKEGAKVKFDYVITNCGDTTLSEVAVNNQIGALVTRVGTSPKCGQIPSEFQPGQSFDCTLTYVVTEANLRAGEIIDTAMATGVNPAGTVVTSSASATIEGLKMPDVPTVAHNLAVTGANLWSGFVAVVALSLGAVMFAMSRKQGTRE